VKPPGEWNRVVLTCDRNRISIELNGEKITAMDLDQWTQKGRRPDGTQHKFDIAYKDHPRRGYIGLQDHGAEIFFRNVKAKPLSEEDRKALAPAGAGAGAGAEKPAEPPAPAGSGDSRSVQHQK
jgi:hypothetical protein